MEEIKDLDKMGLEQNKKKTQATRSVRVTFDRDFWEEACIACRHAGFRNLPEFLRVSVVGLVKEFRKSQKVSEASFQHSQNDSSVASESHY
jgi:hypothetical protein